MTRKVWDTPALSVLSIRSTTQAAFPPGSPDNFSTSDSFCPNGGNQVPNPGGDPAFCLS